MLMKSKKVFLIIRLGTWHMWPSWQPRLGLHTHVTPNLELPSTRSETERSANTRLPAQIKTNTKLSCQNFRFNDLPVATAGDAGGEKLWRAAPSLASWVRGLGLVSPPSSLARRCITNFTACGMGKLSSVSFEKRQTKSQKHQTQTEIRPCDSAFKF